MTNGITYNRRQACGVATRPEHRMTQRQQDLLINIGIEIGITLAGVGLIAARKYIAENLPEAATISDNLRSVFNGVKTLFEAEKAV